MELPQSWDAYARVQDKLDRCDAADDYAWGLEATLNRLLDGLPPEETARSVSSEGRKERHRARLRRVYLTGHYTSDDPESALRVRDILRTIVTLVSAADWALLRSLAEGYEYNEVAAARRTTSGALRTRVSRLRRSLKAAASLSS